MLCIGVGGTWMVDGGERKSEPALKKMFAENKNLHLKVCGKRNTQGRNAERRAGARRRQARLHQFR